MSNSEEIHYIFETADPLNRYIYLTSERWDDHITSRHPEMLGEEKLVKQAVEEPDAIYPDEDFEGTHNYYFEHDDPILSAYGSKVKVVVYNDPAGQINTAFFTQRVKEKTVPIYVKP